MCNTGTLRLKTSIELSELLCSIPFQFSRTENKSFHFISEQQRAKAVKSANYEAKQIVAAPVKHGKAQTNPNLCSFHL